MVTSAAISTFGTKNITSTRAYSNISHLRMLFWIRRTLHPLFLICLHRSSKYWRSSCNYYHLEHKHNVFKDSSAYLECSVHLGVVRDDNLVLHLETIIEFCYFNVCIQKKYTKIILTSVLGALSWNWMRAIFAFSTLVGPPRPIVFWSIRAPKNIKAHLFNH